jgi:hypothetical protein
MKILVKGQMTKGVQKLKYEIQWCRLMYSRLIGSFGQWDQTDPD